MHLALVILLTHPRAIPIRKILLRPAQAILKVPQHLIQTFPKILLHLAQVIPPGLLHRSLAIHKHRLHQARAILNPILKLRNNRMKFLHHLRILLRPRLVSTTNRLSHKVMKRPRQRQSPPATNLSPLALPTRTRTKTKRSRTKSPTNLDLRRENLKFQTFSETFWARLRRGSKLESPGEDETRKKILEFNECFSVNS